MTEQTIDVEPQQQVFLRFERKLSVGYDNVRTFSVSHPITLTGDNGADALEIDRVTSLIQQVVLDAVGQPYEVVNGRVVEADPVERPRSQATPAATQPAAAKTSAAPIDVSKWGDPNEVRSCPVCDGPMFNNRADKASGRTSYKAPDFKCKDYRNPPKGTGCPGVFWHNE